MKITQNELSNNLSNYVKMLPGKDLNLKPLILIVNALSLELSWQHISTNTIHLDKLWLGCRPDLLNGRAHSHSVGKVYNIYFLYYYVKIYSYALFTNQYGSNFKAIKMWDKSI